MSRGPSGRDLDRLLAGLPRHSAPPRFADRVLASLDHQPRPSRRRLWLLAAAAGAAALAAALWLRPAADPPLAPREVTALREEHRRLTAELEALKASLGAAEAPVLYLGGDEEVDLVLDLAPLWGSALEAAPAGSRAGAPRALPADSRDRGVKR